MIGRIADAVAGWLTTTRFVALAAVSILSTGAIAAGAARPSPDVATLAALAARAAPPGPAASAVTPAGGATSLAAPPDLARRRATTAARHASGGGSSGAGGSGGGASTSPGTDAGSSAGDTPPAAAPTGTKVKHVFVVTLHGPGGDGTWASTAPASYLRDELAPKGTLLTAHHAVAHGELANLVALVGGQPPNASTRAGCPTYAEFPASSGTGSDGTVSGDGCLYPVTALTLPDQLTIAGKTWHAYVEDEDALPGGQQTCRRPAAGTADPTQQPRPTDQYALRHNPFAFFHSLLDLGDCQTNDVTLAELHADLAEAKTTPNLTWITPDVCHDGTEPTCPDGTPGGQAGSDAFLREWVPKILDSAAYKADGLLLVLFTDGAAGDDEGGGGRAGALLVSQWTKAGATDATAIDHYGLLRTIEDLFGLDPLGKAASATGLGTNVLGDVGLPPAAD